MSTRAVWQDFRRKNPEVAQRIKELVLPALEKIRNEDASGLAAAFETDHVCAELRDLLFRHHEELGIRNSLHAYATWILKAGYWTVTQTEHRRAPP